EAVTVQLLTQVISEQGRRGSTFPRGLLHDLLRVGEDALQAGEDAVTGGIKHLQHSGEGIAAQAKRDTLGKPRPPRPTQQEMVRLRERLEALDLSLGRLDADDDPDS